MLIPSIDLQGGRIVQLVQGERLALASDDVDGWISSGLELAAAAHAAPSSDQERALEAALARPREALRVVDASLAAIRSGAVQRFEALFKCLEALHSGADPATLKSEIDRAVDGPPP